ncbi:hypothetical protein H6F44_03290 [Pseudanabaena sp. FACHB-1277]|jgi:hypothetical protein|uniref:Uncharacterized protein n=1 Tax=Pseudanabaena cinerea FACHB-1277 TaxID=2949581 RepID=A0A926UQ15_9CYAN|nr:hypothetical protein [Pseudanabaena cinerea]MBD2149154.1 hypothetical protein [Pseudanabaena cinerea FACHB-1277]
MASRKTTHELADLLEEVAALLRDFPDLSLTKLKDLYQGLGQNETIRSDVGLDDSVESISSLSRSEAESKLNKLTNKKLLEFCKKSKIKVGSKQTKSSLVKQILWSCFDAKVDLDHIASYSQES